MKRASQALAQGIPTYRALADHHNVARSTLHDRAHGQRSREQKAQSQQYLTPYEEKAVVNFLLQMAEFGQPVRIKHIPLLAFSVACQRSTKNHLSLQARTRLGLLRNIIQNSKQEEVGCWTGTVTTSMIRFCTSLR